MSWQGAASRLSTEHTGCNWLLELACASIYVIPRRSILDAILVTVYLGAAVATHLRVSGNYIPPIVFGILILIRLLLRAPRLRGLLPLRQPMV
jgi:hypothetical protein